MHQVVIHLAYSLLSHHWQRLLGAVGGLGLGLAPHVGCRRRGGDDGPGHVEGALPPLGRRRAGRVGGAGGGARRVLARRRTAAGPAVGGRRAHLHEGGVITGDYSRDHEFYPPRAMASWVGFGILVISLPFGEICVYKLIASHLRRPM